MFKGMREGDTQAHMLHAQIKDIVNGLKHGLHNNINFDDGNWRVSASGSDLRQAYSNSKARADPISTSSTASSSSSESVSVSVHSAPNIALSSS